MLTHALLLLLATPAGACPESASQARPDVAEEALRPLFGRDLGAALRLPDRTTDALCPSSDLEVVANLEMPPGNVAVTPEGRVFFTYFAAANPRRPIVNEIVDGRVVPFPSDAAGQRDIGEPLSIRVDAHGRLWSLHPGALGDGRLTAWDIASGRKLAEYDLPREVAGVGSFLNDFVFDPSGKTVFIADTKIPGQIVDPLHLWAKPALVVLDLETGTSRRLLEGHPSVANGGHDLHVEGRGEPPLQVNGVDSIAIDSTGEWLYYKAVNSGTLYRVRAADLRDRTLSSAELAARVEDAGDATASDGVLFDANDRLYLGDMEHSAIVRRERDGSLTTLYKDPAKLRWPDGFSTGPDGTIYVTASSLMDVFLRLPHDIERRGPYQIYRFKPCVP